MTLAVPCLIFTAPMQPLQMVTPVAVTSSLLAVRYRVEAEAVAGLVVVSTSMACVTLPITLSFLL